MHAERLRAKYLAWIHDMGESQINGRRLLDHLSFKDGLSYWWMTLFVEKSLYKSPISDVIRLFALEEIIREQKPSKLHLYSANRALHMETFGLCRKMGVVYEWTKLTADSLLLSFRHIYYALPQPVRALLSLARYLYRRWRLKRVAKSGWFKGDNTLFLCSYFIHLDRASCANGEFYSYQWEVLPKLLHDMGYRLNWMQHYLESSVVPNTKVAIDWVQRFNLYCQEEGFHSFLDAYLSLRVVWCILKRWLWLNWITLRLGSLQEVFRPQGFHVSLWPLMRRDWQASMRGPVAISNLLFIELFDQALGKLPKQKKGFYLCENQSWERAFVHSWRKHGHGQLVAVPHSTVRFWDLRHFNDPRTVRSSGANALPQPDLTTLNGRVAVDAYLSVDYPKDKIVESEALRYCYLKKLAEASFMRECDGIVKILVLGDYISGSMKKMMELLDSSASLLSGSYSYTVKPHPGFVIRAENYPRLKLKIVTDPLAKIMSDFDIAYTSNITSAAVDAYLFGLPVVVMLDDAELNSSPLRSHPGVRFVSTPEELSESLHAGSQDVIRLPDHNEFFFLDLELPRWRALLNA